MEAQRVQRRLAAILAADVAGYSRLIGVDEEGTIARLKALRRELIDPTIASHGGRIVKTTGDGILIEFASVVDAVRCAVEMQRGMASRSGDIPSEKRIEFRVGIHLGDVVVEGDDLLGDGVNMAARLEGIAEPGAICLSGDAYRQVQGKIEIAAEDLGEQRLKNIAQSVRVYRVSTPEPAHKIVPALALPDKPSIAVLPFQNMSGDPEREYFADGVVEEIITALSRFHSLFVIARSSSFTYKGRAVDVKQVGRELGVRYVLEGSVRKAASKVRITGQLIDTSTGTHLWAQRFDGSLEDIFDLQDQVTVSVVGAITPKLEQAEIERAKRKPTERLDAYDYYLRGIASYHQFTKESHEEALRLFYRAIELDPDFASAYGMAVRCYIWRKANKWISDRVKEIAETARLARRATELGKEKEDAFALCFGGHGVAYVVGDLDDGSAMIDRALGINPNLADAWSSSGWVRTFRGEPEVAIDLFARAMRLSPLDPMMFVRQGGTAQAHFFAGRYDEASSWAERALQERPTFIHAICVLAAGSALSGRLEEAHRAIARLRQLDPAFRIADLGDWTPLRRPQDRANYADGLRKAGLPE
ncbi:MAG TPA: adenylate/guanylate cyclase domain-containing protein [Stellaceae bacterium]|nr:adenylate/guanylate cyclase domain-containing protein [Stellaceae bacterium]